MIYTAEVIKLQLIKIMKYSEQTALHIFELYQKNDNIEDLQALIDAKLLAIIRLYPGNIRGSIYGEWVR